MQKRSGEAREALIIAGPCSAESRDQVWQTAVGLYELGVTHFRAGLWKPRTRPGGFEGVGADGIPWLVEVRDRLGMTPLVEVALPEHIRQLRAVGIDHYWIGARTTSDPFAVEALAEELSQGAAMVWVKNPLSLDLDLWAGALLRLKAKGVEQLGLIHRGFAFSCEGEVLRNPPFWQRALEIKREFPELPLLCDPSHIAGDRGLVAPIAREALALGYDGLIIESHYLPAEAKTDARQQISPEELRLLLEALEGQPELDVPLAPLADLRREIDQIDRALVKLLARRFEKTQAVGHYKRAEALPILDEERYRALIVDRLVLGRSLDLDEAFLEQLFSLIHEASVYQQQQIKGK